MAKLTCPYCGSDKKTEIARVPADPPSTPRDIVMYRCGGCKDNYNDENHTPDAAG